MTGPHVAVVGAGIVGLSVAYQLIKDGARVTVIDRDPEGDKVSFGNAGGIAVTEMVPVSAPGTLWKVFGWMADPLGPLAVRPTHAPKLIPWLVRFARSSTPREFGRISSALAALNSRVYQDLLPMLDALGLTSELHREGALSLYETESGHRRDRAEWDCKRSHGVIAEEMSGALAREMEPALGPLIKRAVFTPQWSHIGDPRTLMRVLKDWLLKHGAVIRTGEVHDITQGSASRPSVETDDGSLAADRVVIAAGAWSAILAHRLGDRVLLESERGYNMTLPGPGIAVHRELIFAERRFVATPLSCGLRIGGAAEFGGLNAAPNYRRSQALVELARRYLPGLNTEGGTSWSGHRPTTPDSLPIIGRSKHALSVFYAFGHGHLGLTQAATTGRLIRELVFGKPRSIDMRPFDIGRFS